MKQRVLLIVAMLLIAAPAFATVKIDVTQGTGTDVNKLTVSYNCTAGEAVRAFALNFSFGSAGNSMIFASANDINDFNRGESIKPGGGYGIFPGQFRNQIDPANPNWFAQYYTPIAPSGDVDSNGTGFGMRTAIAELGTLYKDANAPGTSGTLFTIRFDANGKSTDTLTVSANTVRGGIVKVDGTTTTDTNLPFTKTITLGGPPPVCTVPNVVNLFESPIMTAGPNAVGMLTAAGFTTTRVTTTSATVAAGKIISTNPAAGATPGCGTAVQMTVSTGPATCATCAGDLVVNSYFNLSDMYNLRGKLTTAYTRSGAYQVDMGSAVTGDLWHVCGNTVTSGGNVLNLSDMYNLRGRLTAGFTAGGSYQAPFVPINVPAKTQAQMTTAITTSNLVVGNVTTAHSATVPVGYVISTNPAYPTYRNCNTTVDMVVSLGP